MGGGPGVAEEAPPPIAPGDEGAALLFVCDFLRRNGYRTALSELVRESGGSTAVGLGPGAAPRPASRGAEAEGVFQLSGLGGAPARSGPSDGSRTSGSSKDDYTEDSDYPDEAPSTPSQLHPGLPPPPDRSQPRRAPAFPPYFNDLTRARPDEYLDDDDPGYAREDVRAQRTFILQELDLKDEDGSARGTQLYHQQLAKSQGRDSQSQGHDTLEEDESSDGQGSSYFSGERLDRGTPTSDCELEAPVVLAEPVYPGDHAASRSSPGGAGTPLREAEQARLAVAASSASRQGPLAALHPSKGGLSSEASASSQGLEPTTPAAKQGAPPQPELSSASESSGGPSHPSRGAPQPARGVPEQGTPSGGPAPLGPVPTSAPTPKALLKRKSSGALRYLDPLGVFGRVSEALSGAAGGAGSAGQALEQGAALQRAASGAASVEAKGPPAGAPSGAGRAGGSGGRLVADGEEVSSPAGGSGGRPGSGDSVASSQLAGPAPGAIPHSNGARELLQLLKQGSAGHLGGLGSPGPVQHKRISFESSGLAETPPQTSPTAGRGPGEGPGGPEELGVIEPLVTPLPGAGAGRGPARGTLEAGQAGGLHGEPSLGALAGPELAALLQGQQSQEGGLPEGEGEPGRGGREHPEAAEERPLLIDLSPPGSVPLSARSQGRSLHAAGEEEEEEAVRDPGSLEALPEPMEERRSEPEPRPLLRVNSKALQQSKSDSGDAQLWGIGEEEQLPLGEVMSPTGAPPGAPGGVGAFTFPVTPPSEPAQPAAVFSAWPSFQARRKSLGCMTDDDASVSRSEGLCSSPEVARNMRSAPSQQWSTAAQLDAQPSSSEYVSPSGSPTGGLEGPDGRPAHEVSPSEPSESPATTPQSRPEEGPGAASHPGGLPSAHPGKAREMPGTVQRPTHPPDSPRGPPPRSAEHALQPLRPLDTAASATKKDLTAMQIAPSEASQGPPALPVLPEGPTPSGLASGEPQEPPLLPSPEQSPLAAAARPPVPPGEARTIPGGADSSHGGAGGLQGPAHALTDGALAGDPFGDIWGTSPGGTKRKNSWAQGLNSWAGSEKGDAPPTPWHLAPPSEGHPFSESSGIHKVFSEDLLRNPQPGPAPGGPGAGARPAPPGPATSAPPSSAASTVAATPLVYPYDPVYIHRKYEVLNLKVVHRRRKTGFEETKDFPARTNDLIAGRYQVVDQLGHAAFSRAVQVLDTKTGQYVCLKIIKNNKDYFDQSLDEVKLLRYINAADPGDQYGILRLYDFFYHKEHLLLVCELLRANLYEFQKYNRESGDPPYFTLGRVQAIAKQVLRSLSFLHSLGLIHCDLKPENILIKSYSRCEVKVIDLGSSCFLTDQLSSYVQSRSYRAPEVMLGAPYGAKVDVWSLGCILAELLSGYVLFQNESLATLLARLESILGPLPPRLLGAGRYRRRFYTRSSALYERSPHTGRYQLLQPKQSALHHRVREADEGCLAFLAALLAPDPEERPTADEALQHPWLQQAYPEGA